MPTAVAAAPTLRQRQIVNEYVVELEKHIDELKRGVADRAYEIQDFAERLHVHPTHLSNTINLVLGVSPCDLYEGRLLEISKELLINTRYSIAQIARRLTYDPSNFTKFFKHFEGVTPKQFREANSKI